MNKPICRDTRKCFAQIPCKVHEMNVMRCGILVTTYPDGYCPFRKEDAEMTDGIYYPLDKEYGEKMREHEQQSEGEESRT